MDSTAHRINYNINVDCSTTFHHIDELSFRTRARDNTVSNRLISSPPLRTGNVFIRG